MARTRFDKVVQPIGRADGTESPSKNEIDHVVGMQARSMNPNTL